MEVLTGFVTAAGAVFTGVTMAVGNSLTVRNARLDSKVWLLQAWADHQAAGMLQIRSPKLHDNVRGIRLNNAAGEPGPLLPYKFRQNLVPQDVLIVEMTGSAVAGDIETMSLLLYYEDLPGADARVIDAGTLMDRMVNVVTVSQTIATGVAGGYSGEEAINAESDLLKANTDYALLGLTTDTDICTLRIRGVDSANLGIGVPGWETNPAVTGSWFLDLAIAYNMPLIPVFNAANKGGILIDGAQNELGLDPVTSWIFAELSPGALPVPRRA